MKPLTIDRRSFLKVAATTGGGLVLGFHLPFGEESSPAGEFAPNAWLRIGPDNIVTITVAKSEMGQGVWTSLPMIVAEELDADWSTVRVRQAETHPTRYGSQSTGGSFSIRGSWQTLRSAGATARAMLVTAAANQWKVDPASCKTDKGHVLHSSGRTLSYGALSTAAANLPVPSPVALKNERDFTIIGKRIRKLDTPDKVRGSTLFGIDVRIPGLVFASIEKCPVFGGTVGSFDATAARSVSGVLDIVQVENGIAVVATNTWAAFQGREALKVTWNEGKWSTQSSSSIRKAFEDALRSRGTVEDYSGDAESAFAAAAVKVESAYEAPFVAHQTMEPMNCTAVIRDGICEVWAPTQSPQNVQREAASVAGLPIDKVTVHTVMMGGGFGRRLNADYAADAVRVAKAIGKPVQVVWTREDDTRHDWYRPATSNILKGGLDKSGNLVSWIHRIAGPNARGLVVGGSTPPYAIPNFLVESHLMETGVPIGAWRSVGPSQNGWILESFIDELAHKAQKDPFEFRRSLLSRSPRLRRTLEYAAEKAGWGKPLPKGRGRGIACVESFGSTCAHVAEVSVAKDGTLTIHRIVVAVDCGTVVNPDTLEAQIEGGVVYGLSAALKDEITIDKGRVQQESYDDYRMLQFDEMPNVEVYTVPSTESVGGIGEPGLPPAAPAVCNAIFAATGKRIRRLPIRPADLRS